MNAVLKEPKNVEEALGLSCKMWRTLRGVSARKLGEDYGYSPQNVFYFERGTIRNLTLFFDYVKSGFNPDTDMLISADPLLFGNMHQFVEKWVK